MKTKINYKEECLKVNAKLKVLSTLGTNRKYHVVHGNHKDHTNYSDFKSSVSEAWENCYERFLSDGSLVKTITIEEAFDLMISQKRITLSDIGKKELEESWEGSSKQKWFVTCVRAYMTIDICSDNHLVSENVGLDYIKSKK